ncbi:hypothetical protein MPER_05014 [Moniliophthora perniciosa FA553]|nr:hypothetical protein MPER_05014 [Moniliophthora perniciosa FA553]
MDCLELNIHQRILNDIATNVGQIPESVQYANSVIASKVQTRDILKEEMKEDQELNEGVNGEEEVDDDGEEKLLQKVFMPASRAHCNIAFGELVVKFPDSHIAKTVDTLMPVLIDVLEDVPYIDFDTSLSWESKKLLCHFEQSRIHFFMIRLGLRPARLSTVSALLRISSIHQEYRDAATDAIVSFIFDVVEKIKSGNAVDALTQLTPALHGLYRAISSTPFSWSLAQWKKLTSALNAICAPDVVDRLNRLPVEIVQSEDEDQETLQFTQTFMARYVSCGKSSQRILHRLLCIRDILDITSASAGHLHRLREPGATRKQQRHKGWNP